MLYQCLYQRANRVRRQPQNRAHRPIDLRMGWASNGDAGPQLDDITFHESKPRARMLTNPAEPTTT